VRLIEKNNVSPVVSDHGEIIYELVGRGAGEATERHSIAHVVIPPGKSSRSHYHPEAEESYYVLRGRARFVLEGEPAIIEPGQIVLIQKNKSHQITNIGVEDLEFLAFCVPAWESTNTVFLDDND